MCIPRRIIRITSILSPGFAKWASENRQEVLYQSGNASQILQAARGSPETGSIDPCGPANTPCVDLSAVECVRVSTKFRRLSRDIPIWCRLRPGNRWQRNETRMLRRRWRIFGGGTWSPPAVIDPANAEAAIRALAAIEDEILVPVDPGWLLARLLALFAHCPAAFDPTRPGCRTYGRQRLG